MNDVGVSESGDEDFDAAVERTSGRVIRAVGVLVGCDGLRLAVAGRVHGRGYAFRAQVVLNGVCASLGELLVESLIGHGVGVPVNVGGGDLRVGEDVGELCQGLGGVGADVGLTEVEEDAVL